MDILKILPDNSGFFEYMGRVFPCNLQATEFDDVGNGIDSHVTIQLTVLGLADARKKIAEGRENEIQEKASSD